MADKIITFLAQLEDFQKQLWLKKQFILETQWCVTLARIPEALYPEIAANAAPHDEWVKLFAIDQIEGNLSNNNTGYTHPLTLQFLKTNSSLALDTRHFDADFSDWLMAVPCWRQRSQRTALHRYGCPARCATVVCGLRMGAGVAARPDCPSG